MLNTFDAGFRAWTRGFPCLKRSTHHIQWCVATCLRVPTFDSLVKAICAYTVGCGRRPAKKRKDLPETVEPAIGMKVMVMSNIATDLDITNGARGTVVNILVLNVSISIPNHGCMLLQANTNCNASIPSSPSSCLGLMMP